MIRLFQIIFCRIINTNINEFEWNNKKRLEIEFKTFKEKREKIIIRLELRSSAFDGSCCFFFSLTGTFSKLKRYHLKWTGFSWYWKCSMLI